MELAPDQIDRLIALSLSEAERHEVHEAVRQVAAENRCEVIDVSDGLSYAIARRFLDDPISFSDAAWVIEGLWRTAPHRPTTDLTLTATFRFSLEFDYAPGMDENAPEIRSSVQRAVEAEEACRARKRAYYALSPDESEAKRLLIDALHAKCWWAWQELG